MLKQLPSLILTQTFGHFRQNHGGRAECQPTAERSLELQPAKLDSDSNVWSLPAESYGGRAECPTTAERSLWVATCQVQLDFHEAFEFLFIRHD